MNYKILNFSTKPTDLIFTDKIIIHIVPDFDLVLSKIIWDMGIRLQNIHALVSRSKIVKIFTKMYNPRKLYLDAKKELTTGTSKKTINVLQTIPDSIPEGKFIVVDHTILTQGFSYYYKITPNKRKAAMYLFDLLKQEYEFSKSKFPEIENVLIFALKSEHKSPSIAELLYYLMYMPDLTNFKAYDRWALVSTSFGNRKARIIPIMGIEKENPIVYNQNIKYMMKQLNLKEIDYIDKEEEKEIEQPKSFAEKITDEKLTDEKNIQKTPELKTLTDPIKSSETLDEESTETDKNLVIDKKQLSKTLKKLEVKDKTVADNVKSALDKYLASTKIAKESDIEHTIVKAIHKSVFGTDDVHKNYMHDPSKLISKLIEVNTFSKTIDIPTPKDEYVVNPKNVILLDRVTGLVRQEYEFGENLHNKVKTLFYSLEKKKEAPLKILDIKFEYQDNNFDRIIKYSIKVQNRTEEKTNPYTIIVKIPSLVNDRYFKLNGKNYIMANQLIFTPITKTNPYEVRLLTNFAMLTLIVVNMKFNISDIDNIIEYVNSRYPEIVNKVERNTVTGKIESIQFKNNNIIDLYQSNKLFSSDNEQLLYDDKNDKYVINKDGEEQDLITGKYEYLFDKLLNIIHSINPTDYLHRTSKSIPYISIHFAGTITPLIVYLWQQLGLVNTLVKLSIDNYIINVKDYLLKEDDLIIKLKGEKILVIHPNSKRQELIINGLLLPDIKKLELSIEDVNNNKSVIEEYIKEKYGNKSIRSLNHTTENMIDPITEDILEFQEKPTNVIDLIIQEMIPKLLNEVPDDITDLKIYRTRQAEVIFQLLYRQLSMAHNTYKNELLFGNEGTKLFLNENYIIENLLGINPHSRGSSVVTFVQPYSPIRELKEASKLTKSGPSGIPSRRSYVKGHRGIHSSHIGNIGANATTEYSDVGIALHSTLTPLISNKYGSFGTKHIDKNVNGFELVSLEEGMIPFINQLDSSRAILAYTHRSQSIPIHNSEEPLICTGAEMIISQLSSSRFVHKAKANGQVLSVKSDNFVKVKYDNGTIQYLDITSRLSTTALNTYILLDLETLSPGTKFRKNQLIAWTKSFNNNGHYSSGRNLKVAIMNYMGSSHEDGYVISEETSEKFTTDFVEEVVAIIPPDTKIIKIIDEVGSQTVVNDIILEFSYMGNLDSYIDSYKLLSDESDDSNFANYSFLNNSIKIHSPGGEIIRIKIFLNNKSQMDPSIVNLWQNVVKDLKTRMKLYSSGIVEKKEKLNVYDNIDVSQLRIGNHKHYGNLFDGAKIVFFVKRSSSMNIGNKMSNRFGSKGVISHIVPKDKTIKGEFSGDIDVFLSPVALLGRKNIAILKELYLGKIFYFLPSILSEKAKTSTIKDLIDFIISIYNNLDGSKDNKYTKAIEKHLLSYNQTKLKQLLINKQLKLNYIVQPFEDVPFEKIKITADLLKIPLDEKVFVPETNTWTKKSIPVGINFYEAMEQISDSVETLHAQAKYSGITGQPQKGKGYEYSSQSMGNLDILNLLTYDTPAVLNEFLTVRSDDIKSKREVFTDIMQNGSANLPKITGSARTSQLQKTLITAMGLQFSQY